MKRRFTLYVCSFSLMNQKIGLCIDFRVDFLSPKLHPSFQFNLSTAIVIPSLGSLLVAHKRPSEISLPVVFTSKRELF